MEKIAVLRRNGLGDLLCAFPLVLYLQQKTRSDVTLFVDARNAPLIPYLPPVDRVVILPIQGHKYWNHLKIAWRYRGQFSMAISAKTSPMKLANWFLFCLAAKKRVAYVSPGHWSFLVNYPIPYNPEVASKQHQALKGLKTVAPHLESVPEELYPKLSIPEPIKKKYTPKNHLKDPIILLSATTTRPASRLHPQNYAKLLNELYAISPFSVLVVGQQEDQCRAQQIAGGLRMETQVVFPRNFDEFMVLVDQSHLLLVGDGGVAHIGAALGKHAVVLFGQVDPLQWKPLSRYVTTFYHPNHVDELERGAIFQALKEKLKEVIGCGRDHLRSGLGCDSSQSLPTKTDFF